MRIVEVELRRVGLTMVAPFHTSHSTIDRRDLLLVRVSTESSTGWGECVALPEPTYTSEWVDGAHRVLRQLLVPAVLNSPGEVEELAQRLAFVKGHPMAKAALEMAVIDAELRSRGERLSTWFGATRTAVPVGVAVGFAASIDHLLDEVDRFVEAGYRRIKLKIEPGRDLEPVAAVRKRIGADVALQVDANGAYTVDDIDHLGALDAFDLLFIEQPFAEHDLAAHAALAHQVSTPVCLDESITSEAAAVAAIDLGACSVVNIKPGRVGGLLEARRIHDRCLERGVPVWCGGMLETGLGRAANLALAALPGFTLPGDISASDRYYRDDITAPFVLRDGMLDLPEGPGIGLEPDPGALDRATTFRELITPDR